jgi:hypothetical protein
VPYISGSVGLIRTEEESRFLFSWFGLAFLPYILKGKQLIFSEEV